ncbi:MAG TPA: ChbG/HpnK family deacetylase [Terriglobales bacterium]|nr:ChbG/HpnK family deacetylase [Terriglobales bacterium]
MPRLIVNADDFGLTPGVNRAIVEAHQRGVVTSATLMASSSAFDEAVRMARAEPSLSVGCHVVLVDGEPVLPGEQVASLLKPGSRSEFRHSLADFAFAALRRRLKEDEVEAEVTAQIKRLQAAGVPVTHVDAHKHAHMFPAVLLPLLRAARACGVGAVRNPFAPVRPLALAHLLRRPPLWTRYSEVKVLRRYNADFRRAVAEAGMATPDGTLGIVVTGKLDEALYAAIITSIPEGTWEFVCHPGYDDADLGKVRTRLRASRLKELQLLTSEAARKAIAARGVELISYAALGSRL